jgi:glutamate synthase (NADPH/NADH) large chain/glutamate synthase (ferredoxin)
MLQHDDDFARERDACGVGFVANLLGYKSHDVLERALQAVTNLSHRGAMSADGKTGDGAGLLTQIPRRMFVEEIHQRGGDVPEENDLAVMMVFFPQADLVRERCREIIEERMEENGLHHLGWRKVPLNPDALGARALATMPVIEQLLVGRGGPIPRKDFERLLFVVRKEIEAIALEHSFEDFYVPSFSSKTIVYKGLLASPQLSEFYLDLKNPDYETALAVFHQRFSTNTHPTWRLAQPFRLLGHNGEINTIAGNRNWMRARERELLQLRPMKHNPLLLPLIQPKGSDSASLDNAMEAIIAAGRTLLDTVAMLIPEAWEKTDMPPERRAFYEYHACHAEPWDGPAAIVFSDGRLVGASLDRNGLRPARYIVTDEDLVIMGSEFGIVDVDEGRVVKKGRLGPGQMVAVDTESGRLLENDEIKAEIVSRHPYREWVEGNKRTLPGVRVAPPPHDPATLPHRLRAFGYTEEELAFVARPMAVEAKDPVFSMGDDTPLAVLSRQPRRLYTYFKQLFAQVTNPPIDPIREECVMGLGVYLGRSRNYFTDSPDHARCLYLPSPLLLPGEYESLRNLDEPDHKAVVLPAIFPVAAGPEAIEDALVDLCTAASRAVEDGNTLLVLSDEGVDEGNAPIPMLAAVSAVHHHLIRERQRMRASIIAATGDAFDIHHFACLVGYGASAIYPFLAFEALVQAAEEGKVRLGAEEALRRYRNAVDHGLLKIMSKMGISSLPSYHGAQIFECIGLKRTVVNHYFTGTPSTIGGITLTDVAKDVLGWHAAAYGGEAAVLPRGGYYRFMPREEYHAWNPQVVKALHALAKSGSADDYRKYAELVNGRPATSLRDLLDLKPLGERVPVEEVEPAEVIVKRFATASISFGALSQVAHETIAIAMNRLGAKSGSGEGGEDPARFKPLPGGDSKNSAVKQVASARFGVTTEYLISARELEIKMAQGSKPGEGGQLPGHKVSEHIARVRHAQPGVTLISPPPHHDIYSIEDLKQLIYDLKQVNPAARISVKLVAESGVGTIAAGVAKAHADTILISGHDGGTGASPLSSIKNAGSAWELGLAETQQMLIDNDLRGRVLLRADGGMKTGRDVAVAALLGAEEFGFGTAALVSEGCVMVRECHLNTCPVGVTSHDPKLVAKFPGTPERVMNYFLGVAREVREILAGLGARHLADLVGRVDLLKLREGLDHEKAAQLNLAPLLADADPGRTRPRQRVQERNQPPDTPRLDDKILRDARDAVAGKRTVKLQYRIRNVHRTVGAHVAGRIAERYGDAGLPEGVELECTFQGSAGQSFGAFLVPGMRFVLEGDANDYVGKAMTGGEIALRPSRRARFAPAENVIAGNTILYGATGGSLFAAGRVGERFCVRNSGATAVVEGVGDHGCEYMTGGTVVILGPVGQNFGAGMSGGVAYVLDAEKRLERLYNGELIALTEVPREDEASLRALIERHRDMTGSPTATSILRRWGRTLPLFKKAAPKALDVVQRLTAAAGDTEEPAEVSARRG